MTVLEKILDEIEDYGKFKGILKVEKNGCDNWIPASEVKRIIRSHMNDGWIPIEEGTPDPKCYGVRIPCFVEIKYREGEYSFRTQMKWCGDSWEWDNGKKLSDKYQVLAWQQIKYPAPYNHSRNNIEDCSTCKNNVEFPPPHTCDICTSLDQEEEYEMWEAKD